MSGLVTRLRQHREAVQQKDFSNLWCCPEVCKEAADEIERLEKRCEELVDRKL